MPVMPMKDWNAQRVEAMELIVLGTGARTPLSTICGTISKIMIIGAELAAGEMAEASRPPIMPAMTAKTTVT